MSNLNSFKLLELIVLLAVVLGPKIRLFTLIDQAGWTKIHQETKPACSRHSLIKH
jgi:hypothetical protein